jgi:hypothetical protein
MANSSTPSNTPNLDKEFGEDDTQAKDDQSNNPRRENFKRAQGDDSPGKEPTGRLPRDDTPPAPDSHEPLREPKENPSDKSPGR